MLHNYSKNNHLKGVLTIFLVTIIWGSGFVAADIAMDEVDMYFVLAARFVIGTFTLLLFALPTIKNVRKSALKSGSIIGLVGFAAFYFLMLGLKYTTPSKSAFLTSTYVVMVPFLSMFLLGNSVKKKNIVGVFITIIGIGLLTINKDFSIARGDLLTLLCALLFSFQIIAIGEYTRDENATHLSLIQIAISAVISVIILFFREPIDWSAISTKAYIAMIYLGVFPTGLGYLMQIWAQKYTTDTETVIILSFESVIGTALSVMIIGEALTGKIIIGSILILISILISELNFSKFMKKI